MNWQSVSRDWEAFVDAAATRWPEADRTELLAVDGDRNRLIAYLAGLRGIPATEAEEELAAWLNGPEPADAKMAPGRDDANIRESARHIPPGEDVYSEDADFGDERVAKTPVGRT